MDKKSAEKIINLEIYTDGSCKSANGLTFGGWSFIAVKDNKEIYSASGSEPYTTNQRMELLAIKKGLEYATDNREKNEKVLIYSDSAYAINCYSQEWYVKWMQNGWVNSKNEDVANRDLWWRIIPYFDNFWYEFHKVKGHAGVVWNEECDQLAQNEAEKLKHNWRGIKNDK